MTSNIGNSDRVLRGIFGLMLFFAPLLNLPPNWSSDILAYGSMTVGVVLITTALFRFCPVYRVIGISTCKIS
jgi:hypothetical protein